MEKSINMCPVIISLQICMRYEFNEKESDHLKNTMYHKNRNAICKSKEVAHNRIQRVDFFVANANLCVAHHHLSKEKC